MHALTRAKTAGIADDADLKQSQANYYDARAANEKMQTSPEYLSALSAKDGGKYQDLQPNVMKYFTTTDANGKSVLDREGYDSFATFSAFSGEKDANLSLADFARFRQMTPQQRAEFVKPMNKDEAQKYLAIMDEEDDKALDAILTAQK
jgi:hypothetical protein